MKAAWRTVKEAHKSFCQLCATGDKVETAHFPGGGLVIYQIYHHSTSYYIILPTTSLPTEEVICRTQRQGPVFTAALLEELPQSGCSWPS